MSVRIGPHGLGRLSALAAVLGIWLSTSCQAGLVLTSGTANWSVDEGQAIAIDALNAYFDETKSRTAVLGDASPGNAAFARSAGAVQFVDPVRPSGVMPLAGDGRARQTTTLEIDNVANLLASWTPADSDSGPFVTGGEQIALQNMQRWSVAGGGGNLIYGDFAIRYSAARQGTVLPGGTLSGLVLTSNIDFLNAAFADIGNASFNLTGEQLTISGDLLISGGLNLLDASATVGAKFGTFSMTANLSAVPEPSSLILLGVGSVGLGLQRWRRAKRVSVSTGSDGQSPGRSR